jgi:hypothetical protein
MLRLLLLNGRQVGLQEGVCRIVNGEKTMATYLKILPNE